MRRGTTDKASCPQPMVLAPHRFQASGGRSATGRMSPERLPGLPPLGLPHDREAPRHARRPEPELMRPSTGERSPRRRAPHGPRQAGHFQPTAPVLACRCRAFGRPNGEPVLPESRRAESVPDGRRPAADAPSGWAITAERDVSEPGSLRIVLRSQRAVPTWRRAAWRGRTPARTLLALGRASLAAARKAQRPSDPFRSAERDTFQAAAERMPERAVEPPADETRSRVTRVQSTSPAGAPGPARPSTPGAARAKHRRGVEPTTSRAIPPPGASGRLRASAGGHAAPPQDHRGGPTTHGGPALVLQVPAGRRRFT